MRELFEVDLAIMNSGSVRIDDCLQGQITQADIIRVLPFGGSMLTVDLKGSLLTRLLDTGKSNIGTGGFLQTTGVAAGQGENGSLRAARYALHGHNGSRFHPLPRRTPDM